MSSTTQFQLPLGPKYSRGAPSETDRPWPKWSLPTTAKPRSVRYLAKSSYRSTYSETPWAICRTARGAPSGSHSTA